MKSFEELAQTVHQGAEFFSADIQLLYENTTQLCLQIAKPEQFECKRFFVAACANTYYSMLGLGDVKILW